mgnify:CR=1 FL=1
MVSIQAMVQRTITRMQQLHSRAALQVHIRNQGINMVSASFPIVYHGKTQGVILVDINVDTFSGLRSTDDKYNTMYVDVLMGDGTFVYDSESDE